MGANFIYQILPVATITQDREASFVKRVKHEPEEEREDILASFQEYKSLSDLTLCPRDVGLLRLDRGSITYLISGGMSWGDAPTDTYSILEQLAPFFELFKTWAKEDLTTI